MSTQTNFFLDLYKSLKTTGGDGFAGRKLTSVATMFLIIYIHRFVDKNNVIECLLVDFAAIFLMMGLITVSQFIRLKEGPRAPVPETTVVTETTTKINPHE